MSASTRRSWREKREARKAQRARDRYDDYWDWLWLARLSLTPSQIRKAERRLAELRALRDGSIHRTAEETLSRVIAARSKHPACDVHDDDDAVTCGWKRTVMDIDAALAGVVGQEGEPR